jgi:hypothetical protein
VGFETDALVRFLSREQPPELKRRLHALLDQRLRHRRQLRMAELCVRDIIEADDGDVVGDQHAAPLQRLEGAPRRLVVGGNDGVRARTPLIEQELDRLGAREQHEGAWGDEIRVNRQTRLLQPFAIAAVALGGLGVTGRTSHEGDAPPPEGSEVQYGLAHPGGVVRHDRQRPRHLRADADERQLAMASPKLLGGVPFMKQCSTE